MLSSNVFVKGVDQLLKVFPLNISNETMDAWFKYLSDLEEKRFIYAVDEVCRKVKEVRWGTNMIAYIREFAAEMEEDCSEIIAKAKSDPVLPLCSEDDYPRQELMIQEIMRKRGMKL